MSHFLVKRDHKGPLYFLKQLNLQCTKIYNFFHLYAHFLIATWVFHIQVACKPLTHNQCQCAATSDLSATSDRPLMSSLDPTPLMLRLSPSLFAATNDRLMSLGPLLILYGASHFRMVKQMSIWALIISGFANSLVRHDIRRYHSCLFCYHQPTLLDTIGDISQITDPLRRISGYHRCPLQHL